MAAAYWELVTTESSDNRRITTFRKTEFAQAMEAAARARQIGGIKCDVRKIVEGR